MTENPRKNVHEYRRERLEPEIAAMSVEIDDEDNPIVIVNIDDPTAKKAIKKVIVWLGGIIGLAWLREWAQHSARRQIALAVAGTAAAATTATLVVTDAVTDRPAPNPPATAQRFVTLPPEPPVTISATPPPSRTGAPPRSRSTRSPATVSGGLGPPPSRVQPAPAPTPTKKPPRTTAPAPRPHSTEPPATQESTAEVERPGRGVDSPTGSPTTADPPATPTQAEPGPEPSPAAEPTVAAERDCDGLLNIELDPLLDVCVLG